MLAPVGLLGDIRADIRAQQGTDVRADEPLWTQFRATPAAMSSPRIFLLGSSGYSAELAGYLGLPFAFAHHFDMGGTLQAVETYRRHFRPSATLDEPHVIVTVNVLAADTAAEAVHPNLAEAMRLPSNRVVGTISDVIVQLHALVDRTGATELMVTAVAYDVSARVRSLELLAEHWGIAPM
jgi:alkanesulfonate monooxygenase SsuD/methylene tetrahydromethanopterin reductase-like flavin-dependent oxidoreductase (luciferase family)